jgi:hypothetical protein
MTDLEQLVDTLLYEGYALFPYTPGATKNATPTPFGIVYPPACAVGTKARHDRVRIQVVAEASEGATFTGTVRFLQGSGPRHEATPRRLDLPATPVGESAVLPFEFDGLQGRARLSATRLEGGAVRVALCVHNTTAVPEGLERAEALGHSLLSTHVTAHVDGGRFVSPLDRGGPHAAAVAECEQVNTWPVLASDADDAVLGAAIMLPDHPQLAPESRGSLFDSTEIEEALLLHVLALSDDEREQAAQQDPAVRAMLARAAAATPEDVMALHGRVTMADPPGERSATVDGVTYRPGDSVTLRAERTAQDHLVSGRTATIERIYLDYDGRVHLAVTVDDDPGQDLLREMGRYLFFDPSEVVGPSKLGLASSLREHREEDANE